MLIVFAFIYSLMTFKSKMKEFVYVSEDDMITTLFTIECFFGSGVL